MRQHKRHPRDWRENLYVYPVISRRSRGLSIGVNLNPDTACNFDCIYCQVDRTGSPRVRKVEPSVLEQELRQMIALAVDGSLFEDAVFADVPQALRRINDIAFSGDGEPTTCPSFAECVTLTARLKREARLDATKIILITDACYLTKPPVVEALAIMDQHNGEIWAKLDAGTEAYYRRINRPSHTLEHVIANITAAARDRPVVIQSLFMQLDGEGPDDTELEAYIDRLNEIGTGGGRIDNVQVYTVARPPTESYVTALPDAEVDRIVSLVQDRAGLRAEPFYER